GLEIWVALSGGANWGGAQVWISSDGSSYALAGTVNSLAVQGVLTADLPPHSSPDATNTLSVDLTESYGQLASVSSTDAANLVTSLLRRWRASRLPNCNAHSRQQVRADHTLSR